MEKMWETYARKEDEQASCQRLGLICLSHPRQWMDRFRKQVTDRQTLVWMDCIGPCREARLLASCIYCPDSGWFGRGGMAFISPAGDDSREVSARAPPVKVWAR